MDKYKFTKEEAVRQIADQLKFHTYVKAINNDPLSSDLEDWDGQKHAKLSISINFFYLCLVVKSFQVVQLLMRTYIYYL